jgi:branched-chain amino acid transport system permease protein
MRLAANDRLSTFSGTIVLVLLGAAIMGFGFWANNYLLQAGTTLAMAVVLCLAWNIVGGYMGYPSFGTAAFFGLGAYAGAILQTYGVPMGLAWTAAGLVGAVFALLLGAILLRLRGHYFAIGTIAVVEVMREIANNWDALTGGAIGLSLPILAGSPRYAGIFFYVAMWTLAFAALLLTVVIARSKFGFGLRCIRQNENAASMVGVDVFNFKVAAFVLSGLVIALAGAVYASMVGFIEPKDAFNILLSIEVPVMVMLGASGTVLGPVIGAFVYVLLRELVWVNFINFHSAILGVLIVAVIYFIPKGLLREFNLTRWRKWTAPPASAGQS